MRHFRVGATARAGLLLVLIAGCSAEDPGGQQAAPEPPRIFSFTVTPEALDGPGTASVAWEVENADSLTLTLGGVPVALGDRSIAAGSIEVAIEATSILELVATGSVGPPASERRTVEVAASAPAIGSFAAPDRVGLDESGRASALLSWAGVVGADEVILEASGAAPRSIDPSQLPDGSLEVELEEDTSFTLIARNDVGEAEARAEIRVIALPLVEVLELDREWVGIGEEILVQWTTAHASEVNLLLDGAPVEGFDPLRLSGTFPLRPLLDGTLELIAANELGATVSSQRTIRVAAPAIDTLSGSAHSLWLGDALELSWSAQGASELEISVEGSDEPIFLSQDIAEIASSTFQWIPPAGDHVLAFAFRNGSGVASESWAVRASSGPSIASFTASPQELSLGDPIAITWAALPDPEGNLPTVALHDGRGGVFPLEGAEGFTQIVLANGLGDYELTLEASTENPRSIPATSMVPVFVHGQPVSTLGASPSSYNESEVDQVILSWTTEHAASAVLYQRSGSTLTELLAIPEAALAAGSHPIVPHSPASTATYRLVVENALGVSGFSETQVTLAPPKVLTFTADEDEIIVGEPVLLSWTTEMADAVSLDLFSGPYVPEESHAPYLDAQALGGTHLPLGGDCGGSTTDDSCAALIFPDGFSFPFDGNVYTQARVYNSGFLTFDFWNTAGSASNQRFPVPAASSDRLVHLAPFWDNIVWPGSSIGTIYTLLQEDPVEGKMLIIQWKNASLSLASRRQPRLNFEIVLWESGRFEYRYGVMDPGHEPTNVERVHTEGRSATIGYQLPSLAASHMRQFDQTVQLQGSLNHRTFVYTPTPTLEKSGSYLWHPAAGTSETASARLRATRGSLNDTKDVSISLLGRPEIVFTQRAQDPVAVGERQTIAWTTQWATKVEVLRPDGTVLCTTSDPLNVAEGFCPITETTAGTYRYRVLAWGPRGPAAERLIEAVVYQPFGVERFEVSATKVGKGDTVTLEWETLNATGIRITANGDEIFNSNGTPSSGSLDVPGLQATTTFILYVENALGATVNERRTVTLWEAALTLIPSTTKVRPGEAVTIQVESQTLSGDAGPRIFGTLPLAEVENAPAYVDISADPDAKRVNFSSQTSGFAQVPLPVFVFPYFGETYGMLRVAVEGYISLGSYSLTADANQRFPIRLPGANQFVQLAPFWDNFTARSGTSVWSLQQDPDTFIIQWKGASLATGSTETSSYDLNFQVVFFRDGSFEYRYGTMAPPAAGSDSCMPSSCLNEANGSSATIGYQDVAGRIGSTLHFGGSGNHIDNPPFPNGLSNRTFRYQPIGNQSTLTFYPIHSEVYVFCVDVTGGPYCKSIEIDASFGVESFAADEPSIRLGESTTLRWTTSGGSELRILDQHGAVVHTETDPARIEQGSLPITPTENMRYALELSARSNRVTQVAPVEVIRVKLSATIPGTSTPGTPISLSWELVTADPNLNPILITPMEELSGQPFADLDLRLVSGSEEIFPLGASAGTYDLTFKDGFTFEFMGQPKTRVQVGLEGYLSFDLSSSTNRPSNQIIPTTNATYQRIHLAPFWDDLNARELGRVYAGKNGDVYVIQWSGMSIDRGSEIGNEYDLNFMVVLHTDGSFEFRYGTMAPPPAPATTASHCYPISCENEANGSAATIGYQEPSGNAGFLLHYGGSVNPSATNRAVPGGLSNRTWKFTKTTAKVGSVQLRPWQTTVYPLCAIDPASQDLFCSEDELAVEVPWGIRSFDADPWAPRRGETTTLRWEVEGLDRLRLLANGAVVFDRSGPAILGADTRVETINQDTLYVLEATSLGRVVEVERLAQVRAFSIELGQPPGRIFPGEEISLSWSLTTHEPGQVGVIAPMVEIDAGPGDPGAYLDISTLGATEISLSSNTALTTIPFDFPYLGKTYRDIRVFIHGYISFDTTEVAARGTNRPLPTFGEDERDDYVHIAPFWELLADRGADRILRYAPDADTFIIQWTNYNRSTGSSGSNRYDLNFQIVFKRSGVFEFRYGVMKEPPTTHSTCTPTSCIEEANGASATIGYQSVDATMASMIHFGGNASNAVPFEGRLEGRSFRYTPATSGVAKVKVGETQDFFLCGIIGSFQDCEVVTIRPVADPGDLIVSELMIDPAGGAAAQWFEVRNLTDAPIDLEGFRIRSARDQHAIASSVIVPAGGFAVLGASAPAGATADYVYGASLPLDKLQDTIALEAGTSLIASVNWGATWEIPIDRTLSLDPSAHYRGTLDPPFGSWCVESQLGSPGAFGEGCLSDYYDVDPTGVGTFLDVSGIGTRIRAFDGVTSVSAQLPLDGFSWRFFDETVTTVWVGINGWVSFSAEDPEGANRSAPTASNFPRAPADLPRGPLIAGNWDVFRCDPLLQDCGAYYHYGEFDGQNALIVQWSGFQRSTTPGSMTFQIQIWDDGDVKVVFGDIWTPETPGSTAANYYKGSTSLIGLEERGRSEYVVPHFRNVIDLDGRVFHFKRK